MNYWRSLYGGRSFGSKPRFPVNPVTQPTIITKVTTPIAAPPGGLPGQLIFSAAAQSGLLALLEDI